MHATDDIIADADMDIMYYKKLANQSVVEYVQILWMKGLCGGPLTTSNITKEHLLKN